jgi:hypothetical protein
VVNDPVKEIVCPGEVLQGIFPFVPFFRLDIALITRGIGEPLEKIACIRAISIISPKEGTPG